MIDKRLQEFELIGKSDCWFSELCFCILTANSKAETAINIQKELGTQGFIEKSELEIADIIRKHKHRFHNNKAKFIVEARKYINIKEILPKKSQEAREFLVKIKGIGYKEASHFLRNVGYHDVAIIDRHILRFMFKEGLIKEIPKTITKYRYLEYENILKQYSDIPLDRLDLILWEKMTGKLLK